MRLDTLTVIVKSKTDTTVTFQFDVTAVLNADQEAGVPWGLWMRLESNGMLSIPGFEDLPMPAHKVDERWAGDRRIPKGKKQGNPWTESFTQAYQREQIAIANPKPEWVNVENYVFKARLVPVLEVNQSPVITTVVKMNL
jgi:hypothetical protein